MYQGRTIVLALAGLFLSAPVIAQTIVDEWKSVKIPAPPELKPVTVNVKDTALLVMDLENRLCNAERRPRCVASLPKIQKLLKDSRARGLTVIYTFSSKGNASELLKEVAPAVGEQTLGGGPDKFMGTDLQKILEQKGMKNVIVVGTAANGAVLYTGSAAAFRGFKIIVPVDGMSADDAYVEQYVVHQFATAPRMPEAATLTRIDLIKF